MASHSPDVSAALATLQARWGSAAPRRGQEIVGEVIGALATAPAPDLPPLPSPHREDVVRTGFASLDAILPGGVPRSAGLALRGDYSSGKTTLALRLAAEAQNDGAIVAWLDVARAFDPVEAVARGVRPEWLVVLTPASLDEGLAMAGTLLQGRTVDLLLVDLPLRPDGSVRPTAVADRLHRLGSLARRAGTLLVVLEPPGLAAPVAGAIGESTGLRLELARRAWIRLGRDVVGQRTEVVVARNRFGPPGRRADVRILYADGGERDACLLHDRLLDEALVTSSTAPAMTTTDPSDETPSPVLAASPSPTRSRAGALDLRVVPGGADRPRRTALVGRDRPRREPRGSRSRRASGNAPRERPSARS
jgi:hypothetical protein